MLNLDDIADVIASAVKEATAPLIARIDALEAQEAPERGEKGDAGEPGADGQPGRDGRGIKGLLIDRDGNLVATMEDGEVKSLGPVVGRDGKDGVDGKDGEKGERGADALGFDDLEVGVQDDDRTIELAFRRGDEEKVFTLKWPTLIDRGVWVERQYEAGDGVTWGGSFWIAQRATDQKPDTADSGWRLAVKKGRDGKDAKHG